MRLRLSLAFLFLIPTFAPGASREIVELQRDVATLQDQVRALSNSSAEKMTAITVLLQQTLDAANNTNKAVAVLESRMNSQLDKQTQTVGQPVAVLGSKVDQMSNDFQSMRDAMTDIVSRMSKLELKLVDLNNTMKAMQAPPPPPPSPGGTTGASGAPMIPASTLFDDALRDMTTGKVDLALKEFNDFMQAYGDTDKAPDAQFYIGKIHYDQNDWASAVKDFDSLIEHYSDTLTTRVPDAMLMKGRALVKLGRRDDGAKEFRGVISKYSRNSNASTAACAELKALGLSCAAAPASSARKKKARA
jgi:TolA-binding protein